jgi:pilus assembly protein Flp/PilA
MNVFAILPAIIADKRGATAIEYGLILALIFLAMLGGVSAFATQVSEMYVHITEKAGEAMK